MTVAQSCTPPFSACSSLIPLPTLLEMAADPDTGTDRRRQSGGLVLASKNFGHNCFKKLADFLLDLIA